MARKTKQASQSETTIGAISGVFPTAAQRALNTEIAEMSVGAQMARDAEKVMASAPSEYIGQCPMCETARYGDASTPCKRCEMYRADPSMYVGADGMWWRR